MKYANLKDAKTNKVTPSCTAVEYPLNDPDINSVLIKINGRYPKRGRTVNENCKELAYVIKGKGKLVVEGKEWRLQPGTSAIIDPGERFYWEGENLEIFMPCTPAWYPEQHKEVE